jgi:hypothetical protein
MTNAWNRHRIYSTVDSEIFDENCVADDPKIIDAIHVTANSGIVSDNQIIFYLNLSFI